MNNKINTTFVVILAGGVGSRFWPLSRALKPKQFLRFNGNKSLLQGTIERIRPITALERIYLIGSQQHRYEIEKQISPFRIPKNNIILEPEGKNTAPAIGLAARFISLNNSDATMIVLPSDHLVLNNKRFINILKQSKRLAQRDYLVTLGIPPDTPHTGYGYIKIKSKIKNQKSKINAYFVEKFIEKPDRQKAKELFRNKYYFWNSGMFIWKARAILEEIEAYLPELACELQKFKGPSDIKPKIWSKIRPISIDYGVLEKSKRVVVIPTRNTGWSDLGSWSALSHALSGDKRDNIIKANCIDIDSKNIAVWGNSRLITTVGLKDLVVVDTKDALLICHKDRTEEVKKIVEKIKQNNRKAYL